MKKPLAAVVVLQRGRDEEITGRGSDCTRCLSCGSIAGEQSGDDEVWHWRWAGGWLSTMPRGFKPGLCPPCARAAQADTGDQRERFKP